MSNHNKDNEEELEMTLKEIADRIVYDGKAETVDGFIKILFFAADGIELASDVFYSLTETDIQEWASELCIDEEEYKITGCVVSLEVTDNAVTEIKAAIQVCDEYENYADLEPYTVELEQVDAEFISTLLSKVND